MKRFYNFFTVACLVAVTNLCSAQDTLTNTGFERWNNDNGYEVPEGWSTLNDLYNFGYPLTATKTADAYAGSYALRLECQELAGDVIDGVATLGDLLNDEFGMPWSTRNAKLTCAYKAFPAAGDTSVIYAILFGWNNSLTLKDTIAQAVLLIGDTVSSWTLADLTFDYYSNATPDSLIVIFSASLDGYNPTLGSVLYIDAVSLSGPATSVVKVSPPMQLPVYPNPAAQQLFVPGTKPGDMVILYDIQGREVVVKEAGASSDIQVADIPEGLYLLRAGALQQRVLIRH